MLEGLFGNKTAEKILLHIFHYHEIHAAAISRDYGIYPRSVQLQLERFEHAGILASKNVGKARLYFFNPKSPLTKPIKELIAIAYDSLPLAMREKIFGERRRPRVKSKPVKIS